MLSTWRKSTRQSTFILLRIFIPSSIGVFGKDSDKNHPGNSVALSPTTIYGVAKHFMENIGNYYYYKHNIDFRSIRYPGTISPYEIDYQGSTDYSSEIFFAALRGKEYRIPLAPHRTLPFVYLDDIVEGTLQLMEVDNELLTTRVYNVQALTFSCQELVSELKSHIPDFRFSYEPDFRDEIVEYWPESLDDSLARNDWKWNPKHIHLKEIVETMISIIKLYKLN